MSRFLTFSMGLLAAAGTAALLLAPGTAESQRPKKAAPRAKAAAPVTHTVLIQDHVFNGGKPLPINGGDSVIWKNLDRGEDHTATSDAKPPPRVKFDTGYLTGGTNTDTSDPVFFPPGDYAQKYYCRVHPDMKGAIIVGKPTPQKRKVKPAARPHRHRVGAPVAPADLTQSRDLSSLLDLVLYEDRSPPAMACEPIQE